LEKGTPLHNSMILSTKYKHRIPLFSKKKRE
jgi:hypothetical protein